MAVSFAFIGFGEAGSNVSEGLLEAGVERIQTYDILFDDPTEKDRMLARAEEIGVVACGSIAEAVSGVDIVFATVTCSACLEVAEEAAKHLNPQQYYLDFNSISPGKKRKVCELIKTSGAHFVEGSVMANVPGNRQAVPMFIGGDGGEAFIQMVRPYGMDVTFIQEEVGQASACKMVRSITMKGIEALYLECMQAARHFGIEDEVLDSVVESMKGRDWREKCNFNMPRTVIHAKRRSDEMENVAETLREIGHEPRMATATAETLRWCASLGLKEKYKDRLAEGYSEVLEAIEAAKKAG
ncbi:MAG TPA: NAD(P)-dependent oxidoreductase [Rhodospirillaceae bacterium]|nr:dehydrogenase [Rhodospirillaceae bacterium]HAT34992.1 NAD(P)-dependent oxidoreductase [Rhodospirillaceae bacterium]